MTSLIYSGVVGRSKSSSRLSFSSSSTRRPKYSSGFTSSFHAPPRHMIIAAGSYTSSFRSMADEFYPLLKLKMATWYAERQIPSQRHWAFCYTMLSNISKSYALVILQLQTKYRNPAVIMYLTMRALDTLEDDSSISTDMKVSILKSFHRDIYDSTWHFPCGTRKHDKVLINEFQHVSNACLELDKGCQEVIEDTIQKLGTSMAKFICKKIETVDDYDEYCQSVTGILMLGYAKLLHASGSEDLPPDSLVFSMGLFLQKTHIIKDYLDDINEKPNPRIFWPREIWSKYVFELEDLKNEENSEKAVQCLNEMVTNALIHVEDCLAYNYALKEPSIFRFCVIPQIMAMGNLALCYDNIHVFRGDVEMRPGLGAKVFDQINTMEDVYAAFYDYSCIMKSKVNIMDPSATLTLSRLGAIQKACTDSGLLNNKRKIYRL